MLGSLLGFAAPELQAVRRETARILTSPEMPRCLFTVPHELLSRRWPGELQRARGLGFLCGGGLLGLMTAKGLKRKLMAYTSKCGYIPVYANVYPKTNK